MGVTRKAIRWANRPIRSIKRLFRSPNRAAAPQTPPASDEHLPARLDTLTIGRLLDVTEDTVETTASPAELRAMVGRIAGEWRRFGETEPHWSVLTHDAFTAENIAENIDQFYESGVHNLPLIFNPLARARIDTSRFGKVLDFGCGVGRLSLALAARADEVIGIDISPSHLRLASERAAHSGVANVSFVGIDGPDDLDRFGGFDLIVSFIVLQHNPPPVIAAMLEKLLRALAPGGCAVLQIPTLISGYRFAVADYLAGVAVPMEMNALPQHKIFEIADRADCRPLEVREDSWMGDLQGISQTFAFRRAG